MVKFSKIKEKGEQRHVTTNNLYGKSQRYLHNLRRWELDYFSL